MLRSFIRPAAVLCVMAAAAAPLRASDNPELATPKLAALAFIRAMELNDMARFKAVTIGSDDDYALFEPLLGMVGSAKQLEKAAREKFGKAGRVIVRDSPAVELEVHVQESDVKVTGDSAVLTHQGEEGADPLRLRHTSSGWKVDLTAIPNRAQMTASADSMARMRNALSTSASDILAGRFKTADEAEQALLKRMREAGGAQGK